MITAEPRTSTLLPRTASSRRTSFLTIAVIVGYFCLGIIAFWPLLPKISDDLFSLSHNSGGDYLLSVWFIAWTPHALAHALNPFFSSAMYAPAGINLAVNTASPLLGLLTAPLAPFLGPVARVNLLMVLSMPVSATAAFIVLRRWTRWPVAAALGGLIYGFSPYMVGQSLGHVVLAFLPLPPFIVSTVVSIVRRERSLKRNGIQLGLLVTGQFLISPEILATVALFVVIGLVFAALRNPTKSADLIRTLTRPIGVALLVAIPLLAYPVWMAVAGPQHVSARPLSWHNDLVSFVGPGLMQAESFGIGPITHTGSNAMESGAYIGVPLLMIVIFFAYKSRRQPRTQLATLLLLVAALLSLGPRLVVYGKRPTSIWLPFSVVLHIPFLKAVLPSRLSFELFACVAAVIAFGLDDVYRHTAPEPRHRRPRRWLPQMDRRHLYAGVVLIALLGTLLPRWPYGATTESRLPAAITSAIPSGNPLAITYPYPTMYTDEALVWQAEDGFGFRLMGGYGYHPIAGHGRQVYPSTMHPTGLQEFLAGEEGVPNYGPPLPVTPRLVVSTRVALSKYGIHVVIVDDSYYGSGSVITLFDRALGPPTRHEGTFFLWVTGPHNEALQTSAGPVGDRGA